MTSQGMVAMLSTVDFYGAYSYIKNKQKHGVPIAFEAKETLSHTSFPLANVHQHQLEYLKLWADVGGTGFFLIHFKNIHPDKAYVTPVTLIDKFWQNAAGRKSIPISEFQEAWLVPIDDYLEYFKQQHESKILVRKNRTNTSVGKLDT